VLLLRIRVFPKAIHEIRIRNRPVLFRPSDEEAIREVFVDEEYAFLREALCANEMPKILDVGAHIGTFAIWCLGEQPTACILSIEADPETFEVVCRNAKTFQKAGFQWSVLHGAAGARDGEILRLSISGPSMSHRISSDGGISVQSISLKALLDRIAPDGGAVDLLKVDIEGSEEAFLCEMPGALVRVNALVIELHSNLCDTQRVKSVLLAHFDHITAINSLQSKKPLLYCVRTR
jgi:FkbM family methyltransferase